MPADEMAANAVPTAPSFYYNGVGDELIPVSTVDDLVATYCAGGARIEYLRDPLGLEHIQAVATFAPLAIDYLQGRFAGEPARSTCGPPAAAAPAARCTRPVRAAARRGKARRRGVARWHSRTRPYLRRC